MTLAAQVWSIIFDAAEREEGVRAALDADIAKRRERTWNNVILPALGAPGTSAQAGRAQAAMEGTPPFYLRSPAGEALPPFKGDSPDLPEGGARLAALHVGGVR